MATFLPENPGIRTVGEEKLINILQKVLSDTWFVFYEPLIDDVRPDLVLYSSFHGIVIIEVKDWTSQTIITMSPDIWTINTDSGEKKVSSPLRQVSDYSYRIINSFSKCKELIHLGGSKQGNLVFPVAYLCYFSKLSLLEIESMNINSVLPERFLLTEKDFSGHFLEEKLVNLLTRLFEISPLSNEVSSRVKQLLYPELEMRDIIESQIDKIPSSFPSLVDEALFICTELRDLQRSNKNLKVAVFYDIDRFLKKRRISEEIQMIFEDMGLFLTSHGGFVELLSLSDDDNLNDDEWTKVFIIDWKNIKWNEKKEAFLERLSKKTSGNNLFFTCHG